MADRFADGARTLALAFEQDPMMVHVFPREGDRMKRLARLFRPTLHFCSRHGGVEIAASGEAVLTWLSGRHFPLRLVDVARSSMVAIPFMIGLPAFWRLNLHESACARLVEMQAPPDFAYIESIGVRPEAQGRGQGRCLIDAALAVMQASGHRSCLLKTENERNIPVYEHVGFRLVHVSAVPASGLRCWVMSRALP
jgi:ribosomal protein S18 acetylase RimI-like enzyme